MQSWNSTSSNLSQQFNRWLQIEIPGFCIPATFRTGQVPVDHYAAPVGNAGCRRIHY